MIRLINILLKAIGTFIVNGLIFVGKRLVVKKDTNGTVYYEVDGVNKRIDSSVTNITVEVNGISEYVETTSGKVVVSGSSGSIKTASGSVKVLGNSSTITTMSGSVKVEGVCSGNINTMSGNVSVKG